MPLPPSRSRSAGARSAWATISPAGRPSGNTEHAHCTPAPPLRVWDGCLHRVSIAIGRLSGDPARTPGGLGYPRSVGGRASAPHFPSAHPRASHHPAGCSGRQGAFRGAVWRWDCAPTWLRGAVPAHGTRGRVSRPSPAPLRAYPFGEMISGCEPCPVGSLLSVKPRATRGLSRQSHPARGSRRHTSAWWTSAGAGPGQRVAPAHVLRVGSRAEGPAHAIPVTRAE